MVLGIVLRGPCSLGASATRFRKSVAVSQGMRVSARVEIGRVHPKRSQNALEGFTGQARLVGLDPADRRLVGVSLPAETPPRPTARESLTADHSAARRGGRERVVSQEVDDARVVPNANPVTAGLPISEIPGPGPKDLCCLLLSKPKVEASLQQMVAHVLKSAGIA